MACYLVALYLGQLRGTKYGDEIRAVIRELSRISHEVERVLATMEPVRELARSLADKRTVLFLGRHVGHPVALEGALKLKELAYMHAEGFAAGELKHGPIALIEEDLPVVVVVPSPRGRSVLHDKIVSNIQEIRARGARTIVIAEEGTRRWCRTRTISSASRSRRRSFSRWSRRCRCRSSPANWRPPAATRWTSRETWRSP